MVDLRGLSGKLCKATAGKRRDILKTLTGGLMLFKLSAREFLSGLAYFAALVVIVAEPYYLFQ